MSGFEDLVERYIASWNEPDTAIRDKVVADMWLPDGTYTDPMNAVTGPEQISAMIGHTQAVFPGHVFRLLGTVDGHHDVARFRWELVPVGGGDSLVAGFDVAVVTGDGQLRAIYGFIDKMPQTS